MLRSTKSEGPSWDDITLSFCRYPLSSVLILSFDMLTLEIIFSSLVSSPTKACCRNTGSSITIFLTYANRKSKYKEKSKACSFSVCEFCHTTYTSKNIQPFYKTSNAKFKLGDLLIIKYKGHQENEETNLLQTILKHLFTRFILTLF